MKRNSAGINPKLFLIPLLILGLDQLSKWLVLQYIPLHTTIEVFSLLELTYIRNTGAAFGFLSGIGNINYVFMLVAVAAVVGISVWLFLQGGNETPTSRFALLFIIGGAAGNLADRIIHGYVIDFISVHYQSWYYPSFNVADSAISIGIFLLLLTIVGRSKKSPPKIKPRST